MSLINTAIGAETDEQYGSGTEEDSFLVGLTLSVASINRTTEGFITGEKNNFAAIGAGILLGYKLFFNSQIGLRAYGDSNFNFSGIEYCKLTKCETDWTNSFNDVAINIDLLWNFINLTNFSHGIALGVGA